MNRAVKQFAQKIREINERYRTPNIEMSPKVRIALIALRMYLLLLVGLMVYKFVLLLT
jgi:hypothetical protein